MPNFNFRLPSINDLTDLQQVAFYEERPILITGGPGSGKTVVSIFRFLRQITTSQNAIFFTFNRTLMSTIRGTLRQQADIRLPDLKREEVESLLENNISSMFDWYGSKFNVPLSSESDVSIKENFQRYIVVYRRGRKFDELFIDESQDLRSGIINYSYELSTRVTCGADRSQDLQGHYTGPSDDMIFEILNRHNETIRQSLTSNFRNTKEIFEFARSFVPEDDNVQSIDTDEFNTGENPELIGDLNEDEQFQTIFQIITNNQNSNIGILVHTKKKIIAVKNYLTSKGYSCEENAPDDKSFSYYYSGMPRLERNIVEKKLNSPFILSFESCKGLEFDIVVMAFFEDSDWALTQYKPNNENPELDANGNPKYWATVNHYYVAATRARSQLYVLYNKKPAVLNSWNEKDAAIFDEDDLPY